MRVEFNGFTAVQEADNGISVYRDQRTLMRIHCDAPLTETRLKSVVLQTFAQFGMLPAVG